jgi:hypothetical protein
VRRALQRAVVPRVAVVVEDDLLVEFVGGGHGELRIWIWDLGIETHAFDAPTLLKREVDIRFLSNDIF